MSISSKTQSEILLKQVNGNVIDLSVSPKFVEHYKKANTYAKYIIEREINAGSWYDILLERLPSDAVVVDAGANVGLFSLYLNTKGKKFYCIEPTSSHINIAIDLFNKIGVDAVIWRGVIFNKDGQVSLFQEASNSTMNRVGGDSGDVPSLTLKTFFTANNLENVDLLKLDIEAAEHFVIMEDPTVGEALEKCKLVFIETHPQDGFGNIVNENDIIEKMKTFGFIHKVGKREMSHYFTKL